MKRQPAALILEAITRDIQPAGAVPIKWSELSTAPVGRQWSPPLDRPLSELLVYERATVKQREFDLSGEMVVDVLVETFRFGSYVSNRNHIYKI